MEILLILSLIALFYYVGIKHDKYVHQTYTSTQICLNKHTRVNTLHKRRQRVYNLYLRLLNEKNEFKASQAMLLLKRIDNEINIYSYPNLFKFN